MNGIHRARLLLLSEEGKCRFHNAFGLTGIIREMNTDTVISPGVSEQSREGGSYTIVVTLQPCLPNELKRCKRP
ncbi:hypothetical protein FNH48_18865 [Salmonella enterica subsp. salamae]|nr:hypothetical protein [Salmonella enterica subsp. salamae]